MTRPPERLTATALAAGHSPRALDAAARTAIWQVLKDGVAQGDAPALVGLVVSDRDELFLESAGHANVAGGTPAGRDALFRIFSMTKPITSVAVMMLVQEKRLGLDDPLDRHLPLADGTRMVITEDLVGHFVPRPPVTPVTIKHLLTHTSGMAYAFSNALMHKIGESAPAITETSVLVHDPGDRWTYGPSTQVIGEVVAKISGQTLDVFLAERIFKPLGMTDTGFTVTRDMLPRLVTAHERRDAALVEQPNPATITPQVRGDYGLYSTASDYGRFIRMLLNRGTLDGRRLLDESTVRQMATHQIGALTVVEQPAMNPALALTFPRGAGRDGWGLGFQIARPAEPGRRRRSPGSLSWMGAMNTYFWIDLERRIGGVLLAQVLPFADPAMLRLLDRFEAAVYAAL